VPSSWLSNLIKDFGTQSGVCVSGVVIQINRKSFLKEERIVKYKILFLLKIFVISAAAQTVDSSAIQQVDSLILVSRGYTAKSDFDKALVVNAAAKKCALETFGRASEAYGNCAFDRGRVNYFRRDYSEAEMWYLESKAVREKVLGKEHLDYAWSLNNLATLYMDMIKYEKAEPLLLEAKAIRENKLGKEHLDYAGSLNNLANLYSRMGEYLKAEPLYIEAIGIKERRLGKDNPNYASNISNLASLYFKMVDYEKAELRYMEAIAIQEKVLGKEHFEYANTLNYLGKVYYEMGNYEKARSLHEEARTIQEKMLGKEHMDYANTLNYLANLHYQMRDLEKAESFWEDCKVIRKKLLGQDHPHYALCLNNLAVLYFEKGNLEKAEPLFMEALALKEKLLGREHPEYASTLSNLAVLYFQMGNSSKAESLNFEAMDIFEKVLGREHPEYTISLMNLGKLYEMQRRFKESDALLEEASRAEKTRLLQASGFLSEKELASYAMTFQINRDNLSAYLFIRNFSQAQAGLLLSLVYDNTLFYKGFLLTAVSRMNSFFMASNKPLEVRHRLIGYRRQLANEYSKPIAERKQVKYLEHEANLAEKELARTIAGYADALQQVKWQEVQAALPDSSVALEFTHFRVNFPKNTDSIMYAALLLRPGAEQPLFIPLFEEKELDHLLNSDKERKADYVNDLYAWADRGMVKLGSEKKSLYELIWEKIEAKGLVGINTIYYSPSGVLHRLNLGAIAVDEETILSDRYNMVALNSTRQLVIPAIVNAPANNALLVGGVNFEVDTLQSALEETPLISSRSSIGSWSEAGTRGGSWSSLTWTGKEVERISTTLTTSGFTTTKYTGAQATEEAIKAIGLDAASPRILHIATHGFFFPDPLSVIGHRSSVDMDNEPVFKSSDNPMIRSGLILAGGNYAWQNGKPVSPDREDGILTAYEISQMNLSNTELVVLSACETGLGDIQGNEGVYGLQRAFKIAGAKYLIMSLWQVPDRETMEFMTTFYKNWLEEKLTIPDAFRKTQREMRDRFFNPYSWAAFVLVE
jgi:CHAT domain-containing protein